MPSDAFPSEPANNSPRPTPNGLQGSGVLFTPADLSQRVLVSTSASEETAVPLLDRSLLITPATNPSQRVVLLLAIALTLVGIGLDSFWLGGAGGLVVFIISLRLVWPTLQHSLSEFWDSSEGRVTLGIVGLILSLIALIRFSGLRPWLGNLFLRLNWDAVGALGEVIGAVGQIAIAILAVYVAWRQYVISKDLTIQQNRITQQQTIDAYFQGVSELVLDAEGLLEDWPQERTIAEGRTASILGSIDADGKAKVLRFLSQSRLLSPLKRDRLLGRAIFDGAGGYQEDRSHGIRVIDLGVMLSCADLSGTDLRWTDLSDANLIHTNLSGCDLVKTNFSRAILVDADLSNTDLMGVRLFYGTVKTATPRSKTEPPNFATGTSTGAVVEGALFTHAQRLSEENRIYCCAWGGSRTRATIPGGCDGIPNQLGR